ncbi:MAG: BrnT family toxin [Caldilineaceae bacterium]
MQFEWDEHKRKTNLRKHGLDFRDAKKIFNAPMLIAVDDREDYGEERWLGIGMLDGRVVVVVFTERPEQTIRIISIMKAVSDERKHSETNWAMVDALTDEEIDRSEIPPLDEKFFARAKRRLPSKPVTVTVHLEPDLYAWFQGQGEQAEQYMIAALRIYMEAHKNLVRPMAQLE